LTRSVKGCGLRRLVRGKVRKRKSIAGAVQAHSRILCVVGAGFVGIGVATEFSPAVMTGLALFALCIVASLSPRKGI